MSPLKKPTIALCVAGSIAAYKAAEIARGLLARGARVIPVMTARAEAFLGAATLSGLTGEAVRKDMWDESFAGEMHVALANKVDAIVIAPATADLIARMASGRGNDLVTALALVAQKPILIAPAMHPSMWSHPATQRNVAQLVADGRVIFVGPVSGPVASGDVGMGRMEDPDKIVDACFRAVSPQDLADRHIVVTAGPTVEDLDPVRFLSNRSTGKMGYAIAASAAKRGARVTLISGPTALPTPRGVTRVDVRSALSMQDAMDAAMGFADALIMSAAVSDFRPAEVSATKQKQKTGGAAPTITLIENPDLLARAGAGRSGKKPVLVGFAVETADDEGIVTYAKDKLARKKVDLIVANHAAESFGRDDNRAFLVSASKVETLVSQPKEALAETILDRVVALLGGAS